MELQKVGDNQIRIITKGPKDSDHTVTLGSEVEEADPFDNMVKVSKSGSHRDGFSRCSSVSLCIDLCQRLTI